MERARIDMTELAELIEDELKKLYNTLVQYGKINAMTTSYKDWKAQQLEK